MPNESVVSGQQVGILGGPLFVLFKILGVIKLSKEENLKPVFWLETNDADFNEIKTFTYYHQDQGRKTFVWDKSSKGETIGSQVIDDQLITHITKYLGTLETTSPTAHTAELKAAVLECFQKGKTLGMANREWFNWLFKDYQVHFFDPQEEGFIKYSQPLLRRELENTKAKEKSILEMSETQEIQANTFAKIGNRRIAIFLKEGNFYTRNGIKVDESTILLPHLKTRSLLQDDYFKAKYYIAGPSEEIYLKQLSSQYQFHQITPAKVIPRMRADLIVPELNKMVEEHHFSINEYVNTQWADLKKQFRINQEFDLKLIEKKLQDQKNELVSRYKLSKKEEKQIYLATKHYLGKLRSDFNKKFEDSLNHLQIISEQLYRQERTYNSIYWLNRYGKNLLKMIEWEYEFKNKAIYLK